MKNIHNMNIFNTSLEEVIKTSLFYKDEYGRLRKKTNDYSGLNASFTNELYVDGGVVRTRTLNKKTKE
tara:strand:+ start:235 stop:438 length:204 start_codon:yes stop_codon:yes gene_type:complete